MKTEVKAINETYTIRGEEVRLSIKARIDVDSGERMFDEELDNEAVSRAFDQYRQRHGMITPERIKALRQSFGLTQRDFAALLGWSATTIATYETGSLPSVANNKLLLALEKDSDMAQTIYESSKQAMTEQGKAAFEQKLDPPKRANATKMIERGINDLFVARRYSEFSGYRAFDLKKFSNMVLFFVSHVSKLTKTKLNKLLFYSDFEYFGRYTVSISGASYARLPHGPVPDQFNLLYGAMEGAQLITGKESESGQYEWYYDVANVDFDADLFSKEELEVMAVTLARFKDMDTKAISAFSHGEAAWRNNANGHLISYDDASSLSVLAGE